MIRKMCERTGRRRAVEVVRNGQRPAAHIERAEFLMRLPAKRISTCFVAAAAAAGEVVLAVGVVVAGVAGADRTFSPGRRLPSQRAGK
jgi:hypothetical protein